MLFSVLCGQNMQKPRGRPSKMVEKSLAVHVHVFGRLPFQMSVSSHPTHPILVFFVTCPVVQLVVKSVFLFWEEWNLVMNPDMTISFSFLCRKRRDFYDLVWWCFCLGKEVASLSFQTSGPILNTSVRVCFHGTIWVEMSLTARHHI